MVDRADAVCGQSILWNHIPHHDFEYFLSRNQNASPNTTASGCKIQEQFYDMAWFECHAQIVVPEEVYSLRSEWSTCVRGASGLAFDPPRALASQKGWKHYPKRSISTSTAVGQGFSGLVTHLAMPVARPTTVATTTMA